MKIEPLNTIQFYNQFYPIATRVSTLNQQRTDVPPMPAKAERIEELSIAQDMTRLFAQTGVGGKVDIMA